MPDPDGTPEDLYEKSRELRAAMAASLLSMQTRLNTSCNTLLFTAISTLSDTVVCNFKTANGRPVCLAMAVGDAASELNDAVEDLIDEQQRKDADEDDDDEEA